jgi:hypothetical protein
MEYLIPPKVALMHIQEINMALTAEQFNTNHNHPFIIGSFSVEFKYSLLLLNFPLKSTPPT